MIEDLLDGLDAWRRAALDGDPAELGDRLAEAGMLRAFINQSGDALEQARRAHWRTNPVGTPKRGDAAMDHADVSNEAHQQYLADKEYDEWAEADRIAHLPRYPEDLGAHVDTDQDDPHPGYDRTMFGWRDLGEEETWRH